MRPLAAACCAALLAACAPAFAARTADCDRACLQQFADGYVAAVVAHDPARLALARDPKFTENGQRLTLGDGLWNTATGAGNYALHIAEVEAGQAVLLGTIREADVPTILVLRLKIADRKIAEIETLVIRNREAAESLDAIHTPRAVLQQAVPAAQRMPRAELARIANMYFSGIELNDGKGVYPIADDCARLENGAVTAGDAATVLPPDVLRARPPPPAGRLGCRAQLETGVFHYVTRIRDRRFVAIDVERGLAFAFAFFDNAAGDARNVTLADGRHVQSGPVIPWTWQIAEVFKIESGKIDAVESVLHQVPYGMGSGWSTWQEGLSSQPRW